MKKKVGEILVEAGIITSEILERAMEEQKLWGEKIGKILIQLGYINEDVLFNVLSMQFDIPLLTYSSIKIDDSAIFKLPIQFIKSKRVFPFSSDIRFLNVVSDYIIDDETLKRAKQLSGMEIKQNLISESEFNRILDTHIDQNEDIEAESDQNPLLEIAIKEEFVRNEKFLKQLEFVVEKILVLSRVIWSNGKSENPISLKAVKVLDNLLSLLEEKKYIRINFPKKERISTISKPIDSSILNNLFKICRLLLKEGLINEVEFYKITSP